MSSSQFGVGSKKETVYDGPTVGGGAGNGYTSASKPVKETVYGGPGTGGTVYNPPQTGAAPPAATGASDSTKKAGNIFFVIAGLSLLNTLLLSSGARVATAIGLGVTRVFLKQAVGDGGETGQIFILSGVLIAIFATLGVFARRGAKMAFLVGLLLYGADTAILCWDSIVVHIPSIIVHGIFLASILKGYRSAAE